jgi:hypothetical protein
VKQKKKRRPRKTAALRPTTITTPTTTTARPRPSYSRADEQHIETLTVLADLLAYTRERGDIVRWVVLRCWAETVLRWWMEHPR